MKIVLEKRARPWRIFTREFFCYCLIGVVNTAVHYAVFMGIVSLGLLQTVANGLGFLFGLTTSFLLNSSITFKKKTTVPRFLKLAIVSGALALVFGALGDFSRMNPSLTFVLYVLVNPVVGFLLAKYFVFR